MGPWDSEACSHRTACSRWHTVWSTWRCQGRRTAFSPQNLDHFFNFNISFHILNLSFQNFAGPDRFSPVPGATCGAFRRPGLCNRNWSCGLHGMLFTDPKEFKRGVWHSHPGQPPELQRPQAPKRKTEKTEKAKADAKEDEEFVQVMVEEVLLRSLEQTQRSSECWGLRLWSYVDFSLICN